MDWLEKIQSSPNPRATDPNPVQSSWWPRSWIQSSPIRAQKIDDVITKKIKILKIWDSQVVLQMIAVIFDNGILAVLFNRLDVTALQAEWPLQNSKKCPRLYLRNRWPKRSENVTNDFRAQENPVDKFWAKSKLVWCKALVDLSWNIPTSVRGIALSIHCHPLSIDQSICPSIHCHCSWSSQYHLPFALLCSYWLHVFLLPLCEPHSIDAILLVTSPTIYLLFRFLYAVT